MRHGIERFLLFLVLTIVLAGAWLKPLEIAATQQVDAGLKRALVSFAAARALNAIISVAQGTDVSIEPGGVGIKFAPGQVLRPINDLVAQFAELMLAASVAFGVMKVLLGMASHWAVSALLSLFALAWLGFRGRRRESPVWLGRVLFVLLLVRFAVPLVTVGSDALFHKFLDGDYATSQNAIDGNTAQLATLSQPPGDAGAGVGERIKGWWTKNIDVAARIEKLKQVASQLTEHIVSLIVIFLMQTLVMPLLLFWALYRGGKAVFDPPTRT
ncbi:MAG: hypothetical protein WC023_16235 [Rhodocyclaceae bacterium]